jgi:hypothetical protein
MNKLLISSAVVVVGFIGKLFINEKERERKREEREKTEMLAGVKLILDERKRIEDERTRLFSIIITSSNNSIKGYRIIRHIRVVSITDEGFKSIAEGKFLLAVEKAGGNGVLNMQVRPHRGGCFSVQGDAVLIEPV